jgi:hypothetical protein
MDVPKQRVVIELSFLNKTVYTQDMKLVYSENTNFIHPMKTDIILNLPMNDKVESLW